MAVASKLLRLFAATSATATDVVAGVRTCTFNRSRDIVDITTFGTSGPAEARLKLAGLQDGTIDIAGTHLATTSTGIDHVKTGFENGTNIFWRMLYDGTNGQEVEVLPENYNIDVDPSRDINFSASMSRNGTLVDI